MLDLQRKCRPPFQRQWWSGERACGGAARLLQAFDAARQEIADN